MNHPAIVRGNTAVVTGAALGIGHAISRRLAKQGMNVVMFDSNANALELAYDSLSTDYPDVRVLPILGDVAVQQDLHALYEASCDFGHVSLLLNNAATIAGAGPWDASARWRDLMEINFWGVFTLQRLFVETMFSQEGYSAIVNLGSKEGITTRPGNAAYSVSKAALRVLTEQLAHELREKVGDRVTAHLLIPGYTYTPMNFPNADPNGLKPGAPWTSEQVANRMVDDMAVGRFYIFCEDNETPWELDQRRMQWAADDLIFKRPALSRWHKDYVEEFAAYVADVSPGTTK